MKVVDIDPDSPLFGHVRPGYEVVTINGQQVQDALDFRYRTADERVTIRFADHHGQELEVQLEGNDCSCLGVTLDDDRIRRCNCDCIFCFVRQQPDGMRQNLYIKDDDYRLSFTHGNFVTLSNVTEEDLTRIITQRLSPLYVSVHTTDDSLRRCMLRNEKLRPILPRLRHLTEHGITIHAQVVVCPGINDGEQLAKTINDLSKLYPGVESLAIVPVGLTKYRDHLPRLRTYASDESAAIIDQIEARQKEYHVILGSRFVWAADEFYVMADRDFPRRPEYEQMAQFENGVGMARECISMFNRRRASLKHIRSDLRVRFLTGLSAFPFLSQYIVPFISDELKLHLSLQPVQNLFWGDSVTVSGLLIGKDLLEAAKEKIEAYDVLVLPPNCLNEDGLFLDDMSLEQFEDALDKPVVVGRYNLAESVKDAFQ
jgi:putative radical SAM enzyme (TIGR03279 family)